MEIEKAQEGYTIHTIFRTKKLKRTSKEKTTLSLQTQITDFSEKNRKTPTLLFPKNSKQREVKQRWTDSSEVVFVTLKFLNNGHKLTPFRFLKHK